MFLSTKKSFWFTKNKTVAINPSLILGAHFDMLSTNEYESIISKFGFQDITKIN